jgi:cupin 2 domain-containing protein
MNIQEYALVKHNNIFHEIPAHLTDELLQVLQETKTVKIERIVSQGHTSPEGFWYDQDKNEWIIVLQGNARLSLATQEEPIFLAAGDYLNIPAGLKHRVVWTDPHQKTIWLAIYY